MLCALVHDYMLAMDGKLYEAFRELDEDDDGKITIKELEMKIKELNVYESVDEIFDMIKGYNLNKDGLIDYEEFLRCLQPDFNCIERSKWFQMN